MSMEPFRDGFFAKMFEYMLHGVAYGKVLHHRGKPYDFIFLYTNPAFKNQLGRSAINGQRISELFPDLYESNSEMLSHLKPVPTGVHPQHFNIYIKTLKQWFSIQIFSPKSDHLFIIFEKFTPKVLIDEHYEQLIGEQKAILDSHIVGIAKIKERKFIWVNNAFASLLGYSANELTGQSTRIFYRSEEDYAAAGAAAFKVLNSGQVYRAELQLVKKDGSLAWFAFHAELLEPYKIDALVMLIDITQKKKMDLKLLAMNTELVDFYENTPCGFHSIGADGTFQRINSTELAWLGLAREEVVGKMKPTDFFTTEGKETFARLFPQFKATEHVDNIQIQLVPKSGTPRWVSVSASVKKDKNGNFLSSRTVMYDITGIKQMEEQVRQHAFYDALTHLPNRYLFEDRLSQALNSSERSRCYGALLFLDLDNFKPLNDSHGHAMGDLLLVEVAGRLKKCVREVDTVSRFGGDEFVIILNELSTDKVESIKRAMKVAKKIQRYLIKPYCLTPEKEDELNFCVKHICSASIGISMFIDNTEPQEKLLKQADSAMYCAKNHGKNSISLFKEHVGGGTT